MKVQVELNDVSKVLPNDYQDVIIIGENDIVKSGQFIRGVFECDDEFIEYGMVGDEKMIGAESFKALYWIDAESLRETVRKSREENKICLVQNRFLQ